jgi:hypothetical protein
MPKIFNTCNLSLDAKEGNGCAASSIDDLDMTIMIIIVIISYFCDLMLIIVIAIQNPINMIFDHQCMNCY